MRCYADSDRGLGTGEFDETVGVDLAERLVGAADRGIAAGLALGFQRRGMGF
jgi:hypothetical protein